MKESSKEGASRRNRANRKILNAELAPEVALTLVSLIDLLGHQTSYEMAWPSLEKLGKKCGKSRTTVKYHVAMIKRMGIFKFLYFKPTEAVEFARKQYGFDIKLRGCIIQAPIRTVCDEFVTVREAAGFPSLKFKDLRSTCATEFAT